MTTAAPPAVLTDHYLERVAQSLNCPPMWLDDCCQEMRIAIWRNGGVYPKLTARRRGIDFLRALNHTTRAGERRRPVSPPVHFSAIQAALAADSRDLMDVISPESPDACVDEWLDLAPALKALSPQQREMLVSHSDGQSQASIGRAVGLSESRVCQIVKGARSLLREACA